MKRIYLIFMVLFLLVCVSYAWGACPEDSVDSGICDTLRVTCTDCNQTGAGPYLVRFPLRVTHDVPNPALDSIAAMVIPLCYNRTNPTKYCSVSSYYNKILWSAPNLPRSIFRHLVVGGDTTHNWMMDLYNAGHHEEWDGIILDLNSGTPGHFWLTLIPTGSEDRRFGPGSDVLLATMTFRIQDTMHVSIDTCFWPPSIHIAFSRADAHTYVPRDNMPASFWIGPPRIQVTSPNGGESWAMGSTHDITWLSENFNGVNVKIDYSTNSGSDWLPVAGSTPNNGSHTWIIPSVISSNCRVRVSDSDGDPFDISDNDFSIVTDRITVTSPNGGEDWCAGTVQSILWNTLLTGNVKIEYSINGGQSWDTITTNTSNDGEYPWNISADLNTSSTCKVKISDLGGTLWDMSNANFSITGRSIITLSPNGGETWITDSTYDITWNSDCTNRVKIQYTTNGGASWLSIIDSTESDGSYLWQIPHTLSDSCKVEICEIEGTHCDMSDNSFRIVQPDFTIDVIPDSQEVGTGHTVDIEVNVGSLYGFSSPCTLSISGLPQYATATFDPNTVIPTDTSNLHISAADSTPPGRYSITVTANETGKGIVHSDEFILAVGLPDFTITAEPETLEVCVNTPNSYRINLTSLFGYASLCTLTVSGLPFGATGEFDPNIVIPSDSSTLSILTINTSSTTDTGQFTLTITATELGSNPLIQHSINLVLIALPPSDFMIAASPETLNVSAGDYGIYEVTLTPLYCFSSACSLNVYGLPDDISAYIYNGTTIPPDTSIIYIGPDSTPAAGIYNLTVTATELSKTAISHSTQVVLIMHVPDFTIDVYPDTLIFNPGQTDSFLVMLNSKDGFDSPCTLTVSGLDNIGIHEFHPTNLTPSGTSHLVITDTTTQSGLYPITITATEIVGGKGGSQVQHSSTVYLVVSAPDFTLDAIPDTQEIYPGGSVNYDIVLTSLDGFASPCTLSILGLPAGATASFNTNPSTPTDTSVMTVSTTIGTTPLGTYNLTVTARNGSLQHSTQVVLKVTQLTADFFAAPTFGAIPLAVNFTDQSTGRPIFWHWYFGDGYSDTLKNPSHTYTDTGSFDVKLVVSNEAGSDSTIKYDYIYAVTPVVANFSATHRSGLVPLQVQFTDQSSTNSTSWQWFFGDGQADTTRNPNHTYTDTGYFSVKLIASNQWDSDTITKPNYVHVYPHLTADFSANPDSGLPPLSVHFTDLSVGSPTSWLWNFGDGDTSRQRNPVHEYSCVDTGYFDVRLIVWNQQETDTAIKSSFVYVNSEVEANFGALEIYGAVPLTVQFVDSSLGCPISWQWNFGDDSTDTVPNPSHIYNDTGYFDVMLIASNAVDSDTLTKLNFVHVVSPQPVLSWVNRVGYLTDGVSPDTALSGYLFTFRVIYSDPRNIPPQSGHPKVNIDLNGDGDFDDESEGSFTMGAVNADTNYKDGREYFYNVNLPASSNCQYSYSAKNISGEDASGEPTNLKSGPVILDPATALDLYIYASDITFSNPHPDEGETFTVFATVHNNSDSSLTNVSVSFYHSGELLGQTFIPNISSRSSAITSISTSFITKGFYPIKVVVDEENSFAEWNELNNFAIRPIIVGDYTFPGGIVVESQLNSPVYTHSWITVTGNAHYTPDYLGVVSGATVTITIRETGTSYTTYTNDPGNFSLGFYGPNQPGDYTVKVEVTDYTITDSVILDLRVISQSGVDLAISVAVSEKDSLLQNEPDTVRSNIYNFGTEDAHNFLVGIYKDGSPYYSYWVNYLPAGDSLAIPDTLFSFATSGWHTLTGKVDANNSVVEYNEGNNTSSLNIHVWCNAPDLRIINLVYSDYAPKGQQLIDLTAWVVNVGGVPANQTFGVQFSDYSIPFDTGYVTSLAPFQAETAYVEATYLYADSIQHSFGVFADFENIITECDEGNNTYGGGPCIDLKTAYNDIGFSDTDPQNSDTVRIIARIFNQGNISVHNSRVRFKIGENQIGQDVIIPTINPGSFATVFSSEVWQVNLSACSLLVQCDPENWLEECNEANNIAYCPLPYDLYLYYYYTCPGVYPYVFSTCSPTVNDSLTIFGVLRNRGGLDVTGQVGIEITDNIEGWLGTITVDSILNHESNLVSGTLRHAFTYYGWHTVSLRADYNDQFYECGSENNNYYSASIFVDSLRSDLWPQDIEFSEECFTWGDSLWFSVNTYNIGQNRAENVRLRFLVDELQIGEDILIDSIPVGSNNYHTDTSTSPWIVPEELDVTHICKVVVDPGNEIPEIREDNNLLTRALPVVPCGDVNEDCVVDVGDVVLLINYLFKNGPPPSPFPAGNVNSDQIIDVGDVVFIINYLFKGGPAPTC